MPAGLTSWLVGTSTRLSFNAPTCICSSGGATMPASMQADTVKRKIGSGFRMDSRNGSYLAGSIDSSR